MRNETGFDLWAGGYDNDVLLCDQQNEYPFAGYKKLMEFIFSAVKQSNAKTLLDICIGTGFLPSRLAENGCEIYGVDFSHEMLAIAQQRIPGAHLYYADITKPLPAEITGHAFDCVISTYALHHLTDEQKVSFIRTLPPLLNDGGKIIIGDVSFADSAAYDQCKADSGDGFDEEEHYWIADRLLPQFAEFLDIKAEYREISHCAGVYVFEAQTAKERNA
jgi:putative AdoMet-dependent methyltransferase